MAIWLYHINPKNHYGYTMGWDISRPNSLLRSADRTWTASNMFNKVQPGDMICVYMKNIPKNPDGIYIVGTVQKIGLEDGTSFSWSVDCARSARTSSHEKNEQLKTERGISFEDVVLAIESGGLLDVVEHPNPGGNCASAAYRCAKRGTPASRPMAHGGCRKHRHWRSRYHCASSQTWDCRILRHGRNSIH